MNGPQDAESTTVVWERTRNSAVVRPLHVGLSYLVTVRVRVLTRPALGWMQ